LTFISEAFVDEVLYQFCVLQNLSDRRDNNASEDQDSVDGMYTPAASLKPIRGSERGLSALLLVIDATKDDATSDRLTKSYELLLSTTKWLQATLHTPGRFSSNLSLVKNS
jgi:hypothetical protein